MKVNINPSSKPIQQTNPQNIIQDKPNNPNPNPSNIQTDQQQLLQLLQKLLQAQKIDNKDNKTTSNEFIIKANMKASYAALKVQNILLTNKKVEISAIGYAIPIAIDTVFLVKKDLMRMKMNVNIVNIELFEKGVTLSNGRNKTVSGLKIILSLT
jgi:DNA-binding protein